MKVSIVIPTYNEAGVIGECLSSLSRQSYKDLEIIVVDDGSTDTTVAQCQMPNAKCQILTQEHKGAGAARNLGANKAKGDILVFVDADMIFDKDFIKKLIQPIIGNPTLPRLRGARGTFSKEEYVINWDNVWARCWNINEGWEDKRRHPKNYLDKQKVFRAILKSEFARVGGFDPTKGYMDDWSLGQKLGYDAVSAPGAVFYHKNPDSLKEVFLQAKWVGKRNYKLGMLGGLIKAWLPVRLLSPFIVFKLVYGVGATIGVFEYFVFRKVSK